MVEVQENLAMLAAGDREAIAAYLKAVPPVSLPPGAAPVTRRSRWPTLGATDGRGTSVKVIVLGAGVVGVTTAWYLARGGAEVRVLDRQPGPGMETSFANAGELSYGMTSPWAAPGIPKKAVQWLFMRHRPLFIWPMVDPVMWAWGTRMLPTATSAPTG